jgi:prepilin-type N-terminal cleavage/methylation domain-containing protein
MQGRKDGFTLVELSIVLVIIGLLIGGILVGQSMIATSKITAGIKQIQQFDAGVEATKAKYGYMPGDIPALGGNGDGVIDAPLYSNPTPRVDVTGEGMNFWNQMDPVTYPYNSGYCNSGTGLVCATPGLATSGANKNVPASQVGKPGSFFMTSFYTDPTTGKYDNIYMVLDPTDLAQFCQNGCGGGDPRCLPSHTNWGTFNNNATLKPSELLALDTKIDDGKPNSGYILSGTIGYTICAGGAPDPTDAPYNLCSSGSTYYPQNNGYYCTPFIRIGAAAGDPQ